jgi:hypothetical protein
MSSSLLMDLIDLQKSNGAFKWGMALERQLNMVEKEDIVAMGKKVQCFDEPVWLTALAIAIIESKFSSEKDLWDMIVVKGREFIWKQSQDARRGDVIIEVAAKVIAKQN